MQNGMCYIVQNSMYKSKSNGIKTITRPYIFVNKSCTVVRNSAGESVVIFKSIISTY